MVQFYKKNINSKLFFNRAAMLSLSQRLPANVSAEMAIPSYLHANVLIQWIISKRMHQILRLLNHRNGQTILDFGCGTGVLLLQLPQGKGHYIGIDLLTWPARKMFDACGRNDIVLLEASEWEERIPNGSIDRIVALEVLEHVDDVVGLVKNFRKKLRADGRLVIAGPTENLLYHFGRRIAGFSGEYHHRNIYDIIKSINKAGFTLLKHKNIPFLFPLFVACSFGASAGYLP